MQKYRKQALLIILTTFSVGLLLEYLGYIDLPPDIPAEQFSSPQFVNTSPISRTTGTAVSYYAPYTPSPSPGPTNP